MLYDSDKEVIQNLFNLGYAYSPAALKVCLVEPEDVPNLTLADKVVQAMVMEYQSMMRPTLNELTMRAPEFGGHYRHGLADGYVGPSTRDLMALPRCGVPDHKHPAAVQEANWPDQCRMEITTSYKLDGLKGMNAEQIRAGRLLAITNINNALEVMLTLNLESYPNTRLWAVPEPMTGSILAYHYFPTNNCGSKAKGAFNSNVTWNESLFPTTDTHEMLHGIGCDHVQDSAATMYPSITNTSQARKGALNATDIAEAVRKGYKKRTTPIPPTPPPDDGEWKFMVVRYKGELEVHHGPYV